MSNTKKRGRPKKEDTRHYQYRLRLSADDVACIRYLESETGKTVAEILRDGVKIQYNLQKIKSYDE